MADDYLAQGIAALEAGDREQAHRLLMAATRAAPNDPRTWGWLYEVAESDEERMRCAREVSRISPHELSARQKADELRELRELRFRQAVQAAGANTPAREQPGTPGSPTRWIIWGSLIALVVIGTAVGALVAARSERNAQATAPAEAFPSLVAASAPAASPGTQAELPALLPSEASATPIASATPFSIFTESPNGLRPGSPFAVQSLAGAKWEIKVVKAESVKTLTASFNTPMESNEGRWAILYMDATNRGESPQSFGAGELLLVQDASGRTFEEIQSATFLMQLRDNISLCVDIAPGGTKTCVAVYDITEGSDFYRLIPSPQAVQDMPRVLLEIP